jgi:hypothetical protein
MATVIANSEAAIFARMIDSESTELTPAGARSWLTVDFSSDDRARMHELAQRAQAGELQPDEEQELTNYRDVGNLLAIMHSRARRALKNAP